MGHAGLTPTPTPNPHPNPDQALSVTLADGGHVSGSPLALTVVPGTIEPEQCVAEGEGLRHAEATRPAYPSPSPSPPRPHPLALTLALAFTRTRTRTRTLTKAMRPAAFRVRMRDGCGNAVPSVADPESPTGEPLPMRLQLTPGLKGQRTAVEDAGGGEG